MIEQLTSKAIPAFERSFPGCLALFAFDNARCHQNYATKAHHTGTMNLTPLGKNTVLMRDGWFVQTGGSQETQIQSMILADVRFNGLRLVLQERALWPSGCKFLA